VERFSMLVDCASCRPSLQGKGPSYRGRSMNWSTSECSFPCDPMLLVSLDFCIACVQQNCY
jgi:hypothetical protein